MPSGPWMNLAKQVIIHSGISSTSSLSTLKDLACLLACSSTILVWPVRAVQFDVIIYKSAKVAVYTQI